MKPGQLDQNTGEFKTDHLYHKPEPATEEEIKAAEETVGFEFPEDYKALLSYSNGDGGVKNGISSPYLPVWPSLKTVLEGHVGNINDNNACFNGFMRFNQCLHFGEANENEHVALHCESGTILMWTDESDNSSPEVVYDSLQQYFEAMLHVVKSLDEKWGRFNSLSAAERLSTPRHGADYYGDCDSLLSYCEYDNREDMESWAADNSTLGEEGRTSLDSEFRSDYFDIVQRVSAGEDLNQAPESEGESDSEDGENEDDEGEDDDNEDSVDENEDEDEDEGEES